MTGGIKFGLSEWLEVINGAWAMAAGCLLAVAVAYFVHEWVARGISAWRWRSEITLGMRVALAVGTISLGVLITRLTIWFWRVIYGGGGFAEWQLAVLLVGAVLGVAGFVCAIREYSRTLFGEWVWVTSAAAIVLVAFLTALPHLIR